MDARQFIEEFGHIASAPGGIEQLRALILNLAVSGKLTIQSHNEHAAFLLKKIAIEHDRLLHEGNFKKNKKLHNEEIKQPWPLPSNWQWVRFAELCSFSAGRTPSRKEGKYWNTGDYPWFSIADLIHGQHISKSSETISQIARDEVFKKFPVPAGTLLMSFKLSIGKLSILGVDAYHNEAIIAIQPFATILKDYFFKCLSGFELNAGYKAAIKGDTLNQDSLSNILVALPPEEEISRIVTKVNELMALCDKLDVLRNTQKKIKKLLRTATLDEFITATNSDDLKYSLSKLYTGLEYWGDDEQTPFELRNAIGAIAYRGLLTDSVTLPPVTNVNALPILPKGHWQTLGELPTYITNGSSDWKKYLPSSGDICIRSQDINHDDPILENPAYVCLPDKPRGIDAIAYRGLLTDSVTLHPVTNVNTLPTLPERWRWHTLGELSTYITSGSRGWKKYLSSTGDIFIRTQDIKHDTLILENSAYVCLPDKTEGKRTLVQPGDLLLTITGGNVGKCAQVPSLPKPAYVSQHVALIRINDPESTPFIHFWMTNIHGGRKFLGHYIYGDKPGLNLTQVASVPVPIPPKEIQVQILDSLTQHTVICNQLLQQVMEVRKMATLFAKAAVAAITGIRTEEEDELKIPRRELISKLRLGKIPGIKEHAPLAAILARQNGEMAAKDLWQRFGGEIDAFYAQLKLEVSKGWILEPAIAEMREIEAG